MAGDQYYTFYQGDYLRDTQDLSLIEHGAYHLLLHHYYSAQALPVDMPRLCRICRAVSKEEQDAVAAVVKRYFYEDDGFYRNARADEEMEKRDKYRESQRNKAKSRWVSQGNLNAENMPWDMPGQSRGKAKAQNPAMHGQCKPSPSPNNKRKNISKYSFFVEGSNEYLLSHRLLNRILERNPSFKKPDLQKWSRHIDLLIRVDGKDPTTIRQIIDWCQKDSFWHKNILSTEKLRDKFDRLILEMRSNGNGRSYQGGTGAAGTRAGQAGCSSDGTPYPPDQEF